MRYEAHPYQRTVTDFIVTHPVAAVFLAMGLGKTVSTLTAVNDLMFDLFEVEHVLVVAPLRVARDTWTDEAAKWDHLSDLSISVAVGDRTERIEALTRDADIHIINRENVDWLVEKSGIPWIWDMVVIDELSGFKNPKARRSRALIHARPLVKRIVGLTGTPAPNGMMDLFGEFRILDGGRRLGRYITRYREAWFVPDKRNGAVVWSRRLRDGAGEEIMERIADITIAMKAADHIDMPALVTVDRKAVLPANAVERYRELTKELAVVLRGHEVVALNAASLSSKLMQLASGFLYAEDGTAVEVHETKLDVLEDIIEESAGRSVLVAWWFREDRARIEKRLRRIGTDWCVLDGRDGIEAWRSGKTRIGLIHPASAGHGLNIQAGGSVLVWFTVPWSLELYEQTVARLWRQGQTAETVTVVRIVADGTIDRRVVRAVEDKAMGQDALMEAVKAEVAQ